MREVPDNQEMWVDSVSDASLILELVEHLPELSVRRSRSPLLVVAERAQNAGSAGVFLQDAVEVDGSHLRVCSGSSSSAVPWTDSQFSPCRHLYRPLRCFPPTSPTSRRSRQTPHWRGASVRAQLLRHP
jgi:hypothetical protein